MQALSQHTRLLTAAVGLPVLAVAVLWGGWPLVVLVAVASLVGMDCDARFRAWTESWIGARRN